MVAFPRETGSKGMIRQLRLKGLTPAVVYGRGATPRHIALESMVLKKALGTAGGMNVLLDLEIKGGAKAAVETVMVRDLQRHPLQYDLFMHADLLRISLDEKLDVKVPLSFIGDPIGVKDGGMLQLQFREVAVRCLPAQIPDAIEVSVEHLAIGQSLNIGDLTVPPGVEILDDADQTLASVLAPQAEIVEEAEAETAEAGGEKEGGSPETPQQETAE